MLTKAVFYVFAVILTVAAIRVITVRNPVHAALYLALTFTAAAGLWLLLYAEFLAIVLVLVYVGAVMVLFLFVVMMLNINVAPLREGFIRYLPLGIAVAVLILIELGWILLESITDQKSTPPAIGGNNTKALGEVLYTTYVYPFELAAVILLVAIVAAIALTLRSSSRKHQRVEQQVKVRARDRLRLISMPAESQGSPKNHSKE